MIADVLIALGRGGVAALLATAGARWALAALEGRLPASRRLAWALMLSPLFTPALLPGYAWANVPVPWLQGDAGREAMYLLILAARGLPLAALALLFAPPPPVSAEGVFCDRLLRHASLLSHFGVWIRGPSRRFAVAFGLVLFFSFLELEIASLLYRRSWTVSIFDAQAGGASAGSTLGMAALPLLAQLLIAGPLAIALVRGRGRAQAGGGAAAEAAGGALGWAVLSLAAFLSTLWPLGFVCTGTMKGIDSLAVNLTFWRGILASLVFAIPAAAFAVLLAGVAAGGRRVRVALVAAPLIVPGLAGPLALSLGLLWLFQRDALRWAYDSPVPLVIALTLLVLPWALFLRLLLGRGMSEGLHASALLAAGEPARRRRARRISWEIRGRAVFWIASVAFLVAVFDLTAAAVLSPPAMTPG